MDQEQHLFLSDDFTRLLDIQDDIATIYRLELVDPTRQSNCEAKVRFEGHVKRLPFGSYDGCVLQLLCLFSPDFSKHIDVDPINKQWIVRESISGEVFFTIPPTFLEYNPKQDTSVL